MSGPGARFKAAFDKVRGKLDRWIERENKRDIIQFGLRSALLRFRVRRLQVGRPDQEPGGVVLLSVVRNAAPWLERFLDHHRSLGIRRFVILDNGSSDGTVALLRSQPDVTLLATSAPYRAYENTMKRYLVRNHGGGGWCLFVDADELFDWPLRHGRDIGELIGHCDARGFNAVICQMLDLWPAEGLAEGEKAGPPQAVCHHYSLSGLSRSPYPFWETNRGENPAIQMHRGGVRNALFGTDNGLTKVSLFKAEPKVRPFCMWHHVRNARIADFTCVLYHYPFTGDFAQRVAEAVASRRYGFQTTAEYEAYHRALQGGAGLDFAVPGARELKGTDELLENGLLVVSQAYIERFGGKAAEAP